MSTCLRISLKHMLLLLLDRVNTCTSSSWPEDWERTRAQGVNQNLKEVEHMKPDIRASITLTREEPVYSGYRPAHLIGNYLTTGIHEYFNTNILKNGETVEGTISFISPEYYPHSLKVGMRLIFQEGSRITGYAEILEIYNELLKT